MQSRPATPRSCSALRLAHRCSAWGSAKRLLGSIAGSLAVDEVSEQLRVLAFSRRSAVAFMGGDLVTADDYGQRSLEGYRRLRQPAEESRALRGLGDVAFAAGDLDRAQVMLQRALDAATLDRDRLPSASLAGRA